MRRDACSLFGRLLTVIIVGCIPDSVSAQTWTAGFGSPADDEILAVAADATHVYFGGSTNGSLGDRPGAGLRDALIMKLAPDGSFVWQRRFGTTLDDDVRAIAVHGTSVYVAGATTGNLAGPLGSIDGFVRKYAADGTVLWTRQFGSTAIDIATAIRADDSGVYVAGSTTGDMAGPSGGVDAFLRKYDANGNHRWTRQFGTNNYDDVTAVALHASGIYVGGTTFGNLNASPGGADGFVRKYDSNGNVTWTRQFGTVSSTTGLGVADRVDALSADAAGIYIAGHTEGSMVTLAGPNAGDVDIFVRRISHTDGGVNWSGQFGTAAADRPRSISVDASGVYVTGSVGGALAGATALGRRDAVVGKYSTAGALLWTRQFGSSAADEATAVTLLNGAVYVGGRTGGLLPGQPNSMDVGFWSLFARRYSAAGAHTWTKQISSPGSDEANSVFATNNAVYVGGRTTGRLAQVPATDTGYSFIRRHRPVDGGPLWTRQFDLILHSITADATAIYLAGGTAPVSSAAVVMKLDLNGNPVWTKTFAGSIYSVATSVTTNGTDVYIAGGVDHDAFVRRLDANGVEIWTRRFGTTSSDTAQAIVTDGSGIYVGGETHGTFPGQTFFGGMDAFVRKYDFTGTELWTRQFGATRMDSALAIAADASGVYVAGRAENQLADRAPEIFPWSSYDTSFARKYDASGTHQWTRQFGPHWATGIAVGPAGVYVGSQRYGDRTRMQLRKYLPDGTPSWQTGLAFSTSNSGATTVAEVAVSGSAQYIAGSTTGSLFNLRPDGLLLSVLGEGHGWESFLIKAIETGNTPVGEAVRVQLTDAWVTFPLVFAAGDTTVVVTDAVPGSPEGDFAFLGKYYEVNTTASFSGADNLFCIHYDDSGVFAFEEPYLRLFHRVGTTWEDATAGAPNTTLNIICGRFASLSPFGVARSGTPRKVAAGIALFTVLLSAVIIELVRRRARSRRLPEAKDV